MSLLGIFRTREFVATYLILLALAVAVAWVVENPPAVEQFSSISVLGSASSAASYFPGNNITVIRNETVSWNVQVYNHMGYTQLFLVMVKLGNFSGIYGPNATTNIPSQGQILLDEYRAVQDRQTLTLPLRWSIVNDTSQSGTTTIQEMIVNNSTSNVSISSKSGANFRLIIELWSYDLRVHDFVFSFTANGGIDSVFDQVWFNAA